MSVNAINPYSSTVGINNPTMFFGRKADINNLLPALLSDTPQCFSIVGQRKIGKTALIQHLIRPATIQQFGLSDDKHLFIYFNCQLYPEAMESSNSFYQELIQLTNRVASKQKPGVLRRLLSDTNLHARHKWESLLTELERCDLRVIVFFDEFEKAIVREHLLREGFFGTLRGYAQDTNNFCWVTSTRSMLHDLFEQAFNEYEIRDIQRKSESDFYNIAPVHIVGLFSDSQDTRNLIREPAHSVGLDFRDAEQGFVLRFGGNFPYFVQRACYHLVNAHAQGSYDFEALARNLVTESSPLWEDYLRKLNNIQRRTLRLTVDGNLASEVDKRNFQSLKDTSLVEEDVHNQPSTFSQEFGHFVKRYLDTHTLQITMLNTISRAVPNENDLPSETEAEASSSLRVQSSTQPGIQQNNGNVDNKLLSEKNQSLSDQLKHLRRIFQILRLFVAFLLMLAWCVTLLYLVNNPSTWPWLRDFKRKNTLMIGLTLVWISICLLIAHDGTRKGAFGAFIAGLFANLFAILSGLFDTSG